MAQLVAHAVCGHVIDGDTFTAAYVPLGFNAGLVNVRVRIDGINAPENSTPEGKAATEFVKTLIAPGDVVTLTSPGPLGKLDNYGRVLAAVTLADGFDWATELVNAGHAQTYKVHSFAVRGVGLEDTED